MDINNMLILNKLSNIEKEVLSYIYENINYPDKLKVRDVAKSNFTSTTTVMRVAKKLGYSGYKEMLFHLGKITNEQKNNFEIVLEDINLHNILLNSNIKQAAEQFISYLDKNKCIYIYGTGHSRGIADYICMKLRIHGYICNYSDASDVILSLTSNIDRIGLVIIISKSGIINPILSRAEPIKQKKVPIVIFTGNESSQVLEMADLYFLIKDNNKLDNRNYFMNLFYSYCLITFEYLIYKIVDCKEKLLP